MGLIAAGNFTTGFSLPGEIQAVHLLSLQVEVQAVHGCHYK